MLEQLLWVVGLTLTPTLELRASIPYAILVAGWPVGLAFAVGVMANSALAPVVWFFVNNFMEFFLKVEFIKRWFDWYADKKKAVLQGYIDKYGVYGLALFIGVPFPGTGVYSGCVAAWLLGYNFRDYMVASFLGCVIAGAVVTGVVASGSEVLSFMIKEL